IYRVMTASSKEAVRRAVDDPNEANLSAASKAFGKGSYFAS
ncbi:MAG: hypothetical protein JWQ87_5339, partial [Candidatus Sulfotelmatobacter sp.]|nr:hypothetical protein [Candidatus Sulfotelmatobacter sp.]